jgi:hypothetical protein
MTAAEFGFTHDSLVSLTVMDRNVISVLKTYCEECVTNPIHTVSHQSTQNFSIVLQFGIEPF